MRVTFLPVHYKFKTIQNKFFNSTNMSGKLYMHDKDFWPYDYETFSNNIHI